MSIISVVINVVIVMGSCIKLVNFIIIIIAIGMIMLLLILIDIL